MVVDSIHNLEFIIQKCFVESLEHLEAEFKSLNYEPEVFIKLLTVESYADDLTLKLAGIFHGSITKKESFIFSNNNIENTSKVYLDLITLIVEDYINYYVFTEVTQSSAKKLAERISRVSMSYAISLVSPSLN